MDNSGTDERGRGAFYLVVAGAALLAITWIIHFWVQYAPGALEGSRLEEPGPVGASSEPDAAGTSPHHQRLSAAAESDFQRPSRSDSEVELVVVNDFGEPVDGAHVIISREQLFGSLGSIDVAAQRSRADIRLNSRTDETGRLRISLPIGDKYYVAVEGPTGVPAAGPRRLTLSSEPQSRTFVVGKLVVGAVLMSDGTTPIYTDWAIDTHFQLPHPIVTAAKESVAAQLGLDPVQVHAVIPRDAPSSEDCSVSICHERVGWFRSRAKLKPVSETLRPTVIEVPAIGESEPPVRVTVICLSPDGQQVRTDVRLMGGRYAPGSQEGFPRFGRTFASGESQLFPPGVLEVSFVDASLAATTRKRVEVLEDATVTIEAPFTPRRITLRFQQGRAPYRGPAGVRVYIPALGKEFVTRSMGDAEGAMRISVPREFASELAVSSEVGAAFLTVPVSQPGALDDYSVVLQ